MASDVQICNLALAHLGDEASVSSISPPDQSAQAAYCANFYPLALSMVLTDHDWQFAVKTVTLAQTSNPNALWKYCYQLPSDFMNVSALFDVNAIDDVNGLPATGSQQSYSVELSADGLQVLYTNQYGAMLKYSALVTNTAQFSPGFVEALSWRLAAYLAGPILKGDVGVAAAKTCMQMYAVALKSAKETDCQDRVVFPTYIPSAISARS